MTVRHLAHGRDVCDRVLNAVGANPDLLSMVNLIEIRLSVDFDFVEILMPEIKKRELIAMAPADAFNNLTEFCKIPNRDNCTSLRIVLERHHLVTLNISSYLELKDEQH